MSDWSLSQLFASLHEDIQLRLGTARKAFHHPGAKGDASEGVWIEMLDTYLPKRYQAANAFVVDSLGNFSDQIDVVVFDRQYSPFIFKFNDQIIVPAESVYAVFEAKQSASAELVAYAQRKVASVRRLHRTSLPIPHAGGTYPAKPLIPILGGLLTFESDWSPALGGRSTKLSMGIYQMDDLIWAVLHHMGIFTSITLMENSILNQEISQLLLFFSGLLHSFNLVALCQ